MNQCYRCNLFDLKFLLAYVKCKSHTHSKVQATSGGLLVNYAWNLVYKHERPLADGFLVMSTRGQSRCSLGPTEGAPSLVCRCTCYEICMILCTNLKKS